MLVLSRREQDRIVFPTLGVAVHVLRLGGNKVRLGVDAPREVPVLRHELTPHEEHQLAKSRKVCADAESNTKVQGAVASAMSALQKLTQLVDRELDASHEVQIMELFRQLRVIDEAAQPNELLSEPVSKTEPQRTKALLVEDNVNEARLLAAYLRNCNMDVALAGDGGCALDYLNENEAPDVVLMDMMMPVFDGAATVRRIRASERHSSLKIYAVSGGDPQSYGLELGPAGVDGWFPKPLDPDVLAFRVAFDNSARPRGGVRKNDRLSDSAYQHAGGLGEGELAKGAGIPR